MRKVEIISASAGSGKTTRIAAALRESIEKKEARPEAVLATTFTNKAAAELKERVRAELFRTGHQDAALRLEGARIGTVNAVCGRLVGDFALELGLSPTLRVLDEDQAQIGVRQVLTRVVSDTERQELEGLQYRRLPVAGAGRAAHRARAHQPAHARRPPALGRGERGEPARSAPRGLEAGRDEARPGADREAGEGDRGHHHRR
jgi:superfamily I DNA/RNA helicase